MIDRIRKSVTAFFNSYVAFNVSATFLLKAASAGSGFVINVLLARLLGAGGYGLFSFSISILAVLSTVGNLGFDQLLLRETAAYRETEVWPRLRGLISFSSLGVFAFSGVLAIACAIVFFYTPSFETELTLLLALATTPLVCTTTIFQGAIRGLRSPALADTPTALIQPLIFLFFLGGGWLYFSDATPALVMGVRLTTFLVAAGVSVYILYTKIPQNVFGVSSNFEIKSWLVSALPLAFIGLAYTLNTKVDIILLRFFSTKEEVGVYTACFRGATLVHFALLAVNTTMASEFARFYEASRADKLQRAVTRAARLSVLAGFPIALGLVLFGDSFLALFGPSFSHGYPSLVVLLVGNLVSAMVGSVGYILMMTKNERFAALNAGFSAIFNLLLNALLIPYWGPIGAAAATSTTTITINLLQAFYLYRKLGLDPTFLNIIDNTPRL